MRLRIITVVKSKEMVYATDPENRAEKIGVPYGVAPGIRLEPGSEVEVEVSHPKNSWEPKRRIESLKV